MTIVPAVLFLLGDRAWKLPAWLDKIIPTVDVEGEGLVGLEAPEAPEVPEAPATAGASTEGTTTDGR
jgi:RND superfamily putative drug exporter